MVMTDEMSVSQILLWKCPKCGRSFRKENQSHYCGKAPTTVDEYILAQDEGIREQLRSVRTVLRGKLPDATEKIAWSMPTYWKDHNIIHFAAQKKHIGLYPGPEAVEFFGRKLEDARDRSRSRIRIRCPST